MDRLLEALVHEIVLGHHKPIREEVFSTPIDKSQVSRQIESAVSNYDFVQSKVRPILTVPFAAQLVLTELAENTMRHNGDVGFSIHIYDCKGEPIAGFFEERGAYYSSESIRDLYTMDIELLRKDSESDQTTSGRGALLVREVTQGYKLTPNGIYLRF